MKTRTLMKWSLTAVSAPVVLAALWFGSAVQGQQDQGLVALKTQQDPMKLKAQDTNWNQVPAQNIQLMAQPMITPRPKLTLTQNIQVQSLHNGRSIAFRLSWKDSERSDAGILGEFSDGVALEFPVKLSEGQPPSPFMGEKGKPVQIYHWRAQYQKDQELGHKPEISELYPNMSVDMYPLEFKDKDAPQASQQARRQFAAAQAAGNPQAFKKPAVDEILAEGFGTSSVVKAFEAQAEGIWHNGEWSVVISRPLKSATGSELLLNQPNYICFAVWQGGHQEVGSRKSVSMMWVNLKLKT